MSDEAGFCAEFVRWWRELLPSRGLMGWTAGFVSTILLAAGIVVAVIYLLAWVLS